MYILGYSGLNNSAAYRQDIIAQYPDADPYEFQGMDAAAVLLCDGKVIAAAEEERFTGVKHTHTFPIHAINFCLQQANITIDEVDYFAHGFNYEPYRSLLERNDFSRTFFHKVAKPALQQELCEKYFPGIDINNKFSAVGHHDAHAASAFYSSDFTKSLILVADGIGEVDSISIYQGDGSNIVALKHYDFLSSIGMLYSLVTHHLGFKINSGESKVMGLAPYGSREKYRHVMQECVELGPNGSVLIKAFLKDKTPEERITHAGFYTWLAEQTLPALEPGSDISQAYKDLAAALQECLNRCLLHVLTHWQAKTKADNLCYAGGVGLNCTANGEILRSGLFKKMYVQPAAGDAGTALGAAQYQYYQTLGNPRVNVVGLPLFGPTLNRDNQLELLATYQKELEYVELSDEQLFQEAASMIADGKIIAWMQGKMEYGPRALGNRSILADPRRDDMRERINKIVKKRESFRPFAPSVKLSAAEKYFEVKTSEAFPHMTYIVNVRPEFQSHLPAITHVNGTARIQTVDETHQRYWQLLNTFESITGLPMLLNTSYNVRGQPMVCSTAEGLKTFLFTELDALFIGNFKVWRKMNDFIE